MEQKRKDLENTKKSFEVKPKKATKKGQAQSDPQEEEVEKMQKTWEDQRAAITAQRDLIREQCAQLQEKIKNKAK